MDQVRESRGKIPGGLSLALPGSTPSGKLSLSLRILVQSVFHRANTLFGTQLLARPQQDGT